MAKCRRAREKKHRVCRDGRKSRKWADCSQHESQEDNTCDLGHNQSEEEFIRTIPLSYDDPGRWEEKLALGDVIMAYKDRCNAENEHDMQALQLCQSDSDFNSKIYPQNEHDMQAPQLYYTRHPDYFAIASGNPAIVEYDRIRPEILAILLQHVAVFELALVGYDERVVVMIDTSEPLPSQVEEALEEILRNTTLALHIPANHIRPQYSVIWQGHPAIRTYDDIRPGLLRLLEGALSTFALTLLLEHENPTVILGASCKTLSSSLEAELRHCLTSTGFNIHVWPMNESIEFGATVPDGGIFPKEIAYHRYPTCGASIGTLGYGTGSLGGLFRDKKTNSVYALTCAHLFLDTETKVVLPPGTKVYQPSVHDMWLAQVKEILTMAEYYRTYRETPFWEPNNRARCLEMVITAALQWQQLEDIRLGGTEYGRVTNFYEFAALRPEYSLADGQSYLVDYMLLEVDHHREADCNRDIVAGNPYTRTQPLTSLRKYTDKVYKYGRTTGMTYGAYCGVHTNLRGFTAFPNQTFALHSILSQSVDIPFNLPGDSGSFVLCAPQIFGMIFSNAFTKKHKSPIALIHDISWLLDRIQKKWNLELVLKV